MLRLIVAASLGVVIATARLVVAASLGVVIATAALAAAKHDLSQYDPKLLLSRGGCGFGQVMGEDGKCTARAGLRQERRQQRRCLRHNAGGACEQDKL